MVDDLAISRQTLIKVRLLSDEALLKLIWLTSEYGWAKASQDLDTLAKEKVT
jgi:hypothetical protein